MMHPRLTRLETLAEALAHDGDLVAVLGLGSSGAQHHRFDDHSDIDFFVITVDAPTKERYLADIDWLAPMGTVSYEFAHDANGRKALFNDGLFVEYAIFTMAQLQDVPFVDARVIWQQPGTHLSVRTLAGEPGGADNDTVDFHLNEALTNLLVGVQRELRGERLSACRFIQVFAVDHVLAITRLIERGQASSRDHFDPSRRVEDSYPALRTDLPRMLPGYESNMAAADAVLSWLARHCRPDSAIAARIGSKLTQGSG
ncbi:MAG: hypothetical protein WKF57_04885 [Nakamurella sp.]